jgi:predicted nucleic-acid-binding Zn-ribbon protein
METRQKFSKWSGVSIAGKGKLVEAFPNGKNSPIWMVEKTEYIHIECRNCLPSP